MVAKLLFSIDEIILETCSMFDWDMTRAYKLLQIQYHWCYLLLLIVVMGLKDKSHLVLLTSYILL